MNTEEKELSRDMYPHNNLITNKQKTWKMLDAINSFSDASHEIRIITTGFELTSLLLLKKNVLNNQNIKILIGNSESPVSKTKLMKKIEVENEHAIEEIKIKNDDLSGLLLIKDAIKTGVLAITTYYKDKLGGSAYLFEDENGEIRGLIGSSNFTNDGLHYGVELNAVINQAQTEELKKLFDNLFKASEDIGDVLIRQIERHTRDFTPYGVYLKALYEYFRGREISTGVWEQQQSKIYKILSDYQRDGYRQLLRIASRYGGALLCDGVGLGKTFVALMLIERMIYERKRIAIFVPKSTREAVWETLIRKYISSARGVFGSQVVVYNHTDLLRGTTSDRDFVAELQEVKDHSDVIIVDEGHNFRNIGSKRSEKLYELTEGKLVFFLTATPINNSLFDLLHLIEFFSRRNDARFGHLGINSIRGHLIQKEKVIESKMGFGNGDESIVADYDVAEAEKILQDDRLFTEVVVQRSRSYVVQREQLNSQERLFPERQPPAVAAYDLSNAYKNLLGDLRLAFDRDDPLLKLAIYYPMAYALRPAESADEKREANRQKQVTGLVRTTMLKRFESSWKAFQYTCEDLLLKLATIVHKLDPKKYEKWRDAHALWFANIEKHLLERYSQGEDAQEIEEDDLMSIFEDIVPVLDSRMFDVKKIVADSLNDMYLLVSFLSHLKSVTPKEDTKLQVLLDMLHDDPLLSHQKVVIFTEFRDTARYLASAIKDAGIKHMQEIDSSSNVDRLEVIRRFAPFYNYDDEERHLKALSAPIRILISTDILSEGLNLQDAFLLINYDLHWNPVRLMQRIGRIDRRMNAETEGQIVAANPEQKKLRGKVWFWNFLPPAALNDLLSLYHRVAHKVLRISETTGLEGKQLLTPEDHFNTLKDFNETYEGQPSTEERLRLYLNRALTNDPELEPTLDDMPGRVFTAKIPEGSVEGVFACYRFPKVEANDSIDTLGEFRWYFLPDGSENVITPLDEINAHIASDMGTSSQNGRPLTERRSRLKVIENYIRTHELKLRKGTTMVQVAGGTGETNRLQLVAWMDVTTKSSE